jgi:hypothetical protein
MTGNATADVITIRPNAAQVSVTVLYGANQHTFDNVPHGTTVESLTAQVKDMLNVPTDATMFIGGQQVGRDYVLRSGDRVEYIKQAGKKA